MFVDCTSPVRIGREVITSFTNIYTHEMNYAWVTEGRIRRKSGPVIVGNRASLAPGIHIGANVSIGEHSIIGSGSVVLKDIAPYVLAAGVPCREIRSIRNEFLVEQDILDEVRRDLEDFVHKKYPKRRIQLLFKESIWPPVLSEHRGTELILVGNYVADEVFSVLKARRSAVSVFDLRRQLYHKNGSELTHELKWRMRRFGLVFKPYSPKAFGLTA
ncbi:acyltransferase [Candidatus Bathyarchaeota archaeon]|nr:acyltransferase [Candidatus Bathyarchaeota archaeon]